MIPELVVPAIEPVTADAPIAIHALPAHPLWRDPVADSRAPRAAVTVRAVGVPGIDATLALPLPLVAVEGSAWRAQLGLSTALFLGFTGEGALVFDFETFDGWFALPLDVASGSWTARLELAHLSAHYGDGVRDNGDRPGNFDPYSREWVRLWGARAVGPARLYASGWALIHALPEAPPFGVSGGAEVEGPWPLAPYAAVDVRLAQEDDWAPALGGQLGGRLRTGAHQLRLGVAARVGPEDTGKLRPGGEAWLGVTLTYDRLGTPVD